MAGVGYARVPMGHRGTDKHLDALKTADCERIFEETISGSFGCRGDTRLLGPAPPCISFQVAFVRCHHCCHEDCQFAL